MGSAGGTHTPRDDWRDDPEAVGCVWTEGGKLFGALRVAANAFYTLIPCLVVNRFKKLEIKVRGMKYRRGDLDGFELYH
jgi:hypothetical protein